MNQLEANKVLDDAKARCKFYLFPGMRCDSPSGHSGPCTNHESEA